MLAAEPWYKEAMGMADELLQKREQLLRDYADTTEVNQDLLHEVGSLASRLGQEPHLFFELFRDKVKEEVQFFFDTKVDAALSGREDVYTVGSGGPDAKGVSFVPRYSIKSNHGPDFHIYADALEGKVLGTAVKAVHMTSAYPRDGQSPQEIAEFIRNDLQLAFQGVGRVTVQMRPVVTSTYGDEYEFQIRLLVEIPITLPVDPSWISDLEYLPNLLPNPLDRSLGTDVGARP